MVTWISYKGDRSVCEQGFGRSIIRALGMPDTQKITRLIMVGFPHQFSGMLSPTSHPIVSLSYGLRSPEGPGNESLVADKAVLA